MENDKIIFLIWLIIMALLVIIMLYRGKRALSIFPNIESVDVKYHDKSAKGYSTKSFMTKMSGANGFFEIVVTQEELWLKSTLMFSHILKTNDLLHKVPLNKITNCQRKKLDVIVDFKTNENLHKQVVLRTKDPNLFMIKLNERNIQL